MTDERQLAINPIVQTSMQTNAKIISNIRNLTASLFGIAAGTLGLESYPGFAFYLLATLAVQVVILLCARLNGARKTGRPAALMDASDYFYAPVSQFWIGDAFGPFMGFVLTWTLFYGLVRA